VLSAIVGLLEDTLMKLCRRIINGTLHSIFGLVVVAMSGLPAHAEPILLAQLYHSETLNHDDDQYLLFGINIATVGSNAQMSRNPTTSADVGKTFPADAATVAMFHDRLAGPTAGGQVISALSYFGMVSPDSVGIGHFFSGPYTMGEFPTVPVPENQFIMKEFIPEPAFKGYYRITGVTQTIDAASIDPVPFFPTRSLYWGAQTIRFFGERIPEPSTCLLVGICLAMLASRRPPNSSRERTIHRLLEDTLMNSCCRICIATVLLLVTASTIHFVS
jgi:hypothetical protein